MIAGHSCQTNGAASSLLLYGVGAPFLIAGEAIENKKCKYHRSSQTFSFPELPAMCSCHLRDLCPRGRGKLHGRSEPKLGFDPHNAEGRPGLKRNLSSGRRSHII